MLENIWSRGQTWLLGMKVGRWISGGIVWFFRACPEVWVEHRYMIQGLPSPSPRVTRVRLSFLPRPYPSLRLSLSLSLPLIQTSTTHFDSEQVRGHVQQSTVILSYAIQGISYNPLNLKVKDRRVRSSFRSKSGYEVSQGCCVVLEGKRRGAILGDSWRGQWEPMLVSVVGEVEDCDLWYLRSQLWWCFT